MPTLHSAIPAPERSHHPSRLPLAHLLLLLIPTASLAHAQQPSEPSLQITTTLVQVPTLVRTPTDDLVFSLSAPDFRLLDNGAPQRLNLESASGQPLSLLVLVQTGANAPRLFDAFGNLSTMLEPILRGPRNQIAVVTFDSRPEGALPFTRDLTPFLDAINHPDPGDHRAAILDALAFSLDLFKDQPSSNRRAILLLSQTHDLGSKTTIKEVVRRLGETSTAIYSVAFSSAEASFKGAFTDPAHLNPPWHVGNRDYSYYFNLSEPLGMILDAMKKDSASELANLSGGEAAHFSNRQQLETALGDLANHLPNRYLLTFHPTGNQPGLHTLNVSVPSHPEFRVAARASYWSTATPH